MKHIYKPKFLLLSLLLTIGSCTAGVTRLAPGQDTDIDLSGSWNDTDSRLVAEDMIGDLLLKFLKRDDKLQTSFSKPVIMVGDIINKTHEHIDSATFIKDIEKGLVINGDVILVTNSSFRQKLREERKSQAGYSSTQQQKNIASELGAEYLLLGSISSIVDVKGDQKVIYYQVNLELTSVTTNQVLWIGDKKIKKYIGRTSKISKNKTKQQRNKI